MTKVLATLACFALAALATPAPACTDPGGIGGTGIDGGGIGGTGQRAEADVGVVGVITGFASICVNGIEVHYDAATPVSVNGAPAHAGALAVGQVVAVRAVGSGTQARARSIDVVDAVVGTVNAVESGGALVQVNGQRVRVAPSTQLGGGLTREQLASVQAGETLRVSGLRSADGSVVATRIERGTPGARPFSADASDPGLGRFVVQGYVADVQPQALRVGATSFSLGPAAAGQLARDSLVRLSGRSERGNRIVERADVLREPLDVRPERSVRIERSSRDGDDRRRGREDSDRSGRGGGSGRDRDSERVDRSGRSGPDRIERAERPDRSGPSGRPERPERIDRSGRH
jgi:hypothetical protein